MKVVLDTSVLMFLLDPSASAPLDVVTGKPVEHCQERIEGLLEDFDKSGVQLIVPTPVLSELLIKAGGRQVEVLAALVNKKSVQVLTFDEAAAVENAAMRRGDLSKKTRGETKKEVSFDLQILAIARVAGAKIILSDDENLRARAARAGMEVRGIAQISLADAKRQISMFSDRPEDAESPAEEGASDGHVIEVSDGSDALSEVTSRKASNVESNGTLSDEI